jgi:hypothetical protein
MQVGEGVIVTGAKNAARAIAYGLLAAVPNRM